MAGEPDVRRSFEVLEAGKLKEFSADRNVAVALLCYLSKDEEKLRELVAELVRLKCRHVSIYGNQNTLIEDEIDQLLEETELGLEVSTASHVGETENEVVNLVFSLLPSDACAIAVYGDSLKSRHIVAEFKRVGRSVTQ